MFKIFPCIQLHAYYQLSDNGVFGLVSHSTKNRTNLQPRKAHLRVNLYGLQMFIFETTETYGYPYLSSYRRSVRKHRYLFSHYASSC